VRERLDRLSPGLGNPVMKVEVHDVPDPGPAAAAAAMPEPETAATEQQEQELHRALERIAARLDLLERRLAEAAGQEAEGGQR
jgi:hypothetical protein